MTDKTLLCAGPWIGEFGHELMRWQGHVRHMAKSFDKTVICCQTGHEFIYKDFASEFINYDHKESGDCWHDGTKEIPNVWNGDFFIDMMKRNGYPKVTIVRPGKDMCEGTIKQDFISWKTQERWRNANILIHARRRSIGADRNWSLYRFDKLTDELDYDFDFITIGSKDGADEIPGIEDRRGIPLAELAKLMSDSWGVVGPSSGIHHFAALCGCRSVVWTDKSKWHLGGQKGTNRHRYESVWNPLKTRVVVIDHQGWQPNFETVANVIYNENYGIPQKIPQ